MRQPTLELAVVFNRAVRHEDEWFEEPDDLERVERALASIDGIDDPIEAAAGLAYRVVRAQGFGEGNKRTALLLARWLLDRNGLDGSAVIPHDDQEFAPLLVRAAAGADVEDEMKALFQSRR